MSPTTTDTDTTSMDDLNRPIQYMNDSSNNNFMPFITGVYNQEPVTYKHSYTLFLPLITPQYTS